MITYDKKEKVYIYLLFFEDDLNVVYVGQTNDLTSRYSQHTFPSTLSVRSKKNSWLKKNLSLRKPLMLRVLEECEDRHSANESERYWIDYLRTEGYILKNSTNGGEGIVGLKRTKEHKAKISETLKFKSSFLDAGVREKARATLSSRPRTDRQKAQWDRVIENSKGRSKSEPTRKLMSENLKSRWKNKSPEDRLSMNRKSLEPEYMEKRIQGLAKNYHFITPEGKELHVKNLKKFCRDNGLAQTSMRYLAIGRSESYKGWKVDPTKPQGYKIKSN